MHSPLEAYLDQVAAHLSALPPKRRSEELREMRAHLLNAVTVNRELGQSEEDAAADAVMQFGTPEDLGGNLVWAWKRERERDKRSLWGGAACTVSVLCMQCFLMNQRAFDLLLDSLLPHTFLLFLGKHPGYGMDFTQAMFMVAFGLAGLTAGSLFPRLAVRGVCLGLTLFWIGFVAVDGVGHGGVWRFFSFTLCNGWTLAAIMSAWISSRLRLKWNKRRRLARV